MKLSTSFDQPQLSFAPDPKGERLYGNVSNMVQITLTHPVGETRGVAVAVPTGLFTIMKQVFKVEPHHRTEMYLHEYEPGKFVFGIEWGEDDNDFADLWTYTWAALPGVFKEFIEVGA